MGNTHPNANTKTRTYQNKAFHEQAEGPLLIKSVTMASSNNYSAMESPKGPRKPFGEISNRLNTPSKEEFNGGSKDQQGEPEGALTPLANLKMLIRVASETNPDLPPKRELFRENSDSVEDHDYYSSPSSGLTNLGEF